jgi:glycosyltransferase involved in cell wall biosynthesis
MSDPSVSIVIDNFNYGRFVAAAIQSALDQTYPHVEVVVVDDGSTDDSRAVISRFADRVTTIFQENAGQSAAFYTGFRASRGDIVIFLDSDDAIRPEAVATIVAHWRPGVTKAQWCLSAVDAEGGFLGSIFPNYPPGLTSDDVRREVLRTALYPCPPTSGNAYARWFLEKVLPVHVLRQGTDGPLNAVAPLYGETVTIDRALSYYRVHGSNDGAQKFLVPERFARFIEMDMARSAFLRRHALRLDFDVIGEPNDHAILHLQYRLASLKLCPEKHPVEGETLGDAVRLAISAAATGRDRPVSRVLVALWCLALALSPRRVAEKLVTWRFVPESRSPVLNKILRWLRILREPEVGDRREEMNLPAKLGRRPAEA